MDNYAYGWVANSPSVDDIPGKNITLTGKNFETLNLLTAEPNDTITTGAFVPFGTLHTQDKLF